MNAFLSTKWFNSHRKTGGQKKAKRSRQRTVNIDAAIESLENRLLLSTANWIGGTGNWNDPSMWSDNAVPVSGDTVNINVAGSVVNVTDAERSDNITTTVNTTLNIESGGNLFLDNGGLIAGALSVSAPQNGAAAGELGTGYSNQLTFAGMSTISGLLSQGEITNTGSLSLSAASFVSTATFTNSGLVNITGGLAFGQNLDLVNQSGGTVDLLDDVGLSGNGTISNLGTLTLNGGAGSVALSSIQLQDLSGTISVQSGTLSDANSAFFNNATFNIATGAVFAFDPISATNNGDVFYFSGTSTASGAGGLLFNGGSVTPGYPNAQATSATLNFNSGSAQVSGTAFVNNPQDGSIGEVTNDGFLNFVGTAAHGALGIINNGTLEVSGTGDIGISTGSTLTNEPTGIIDFASDGSFAGFGGNTSFTNFGTIEKTGGTGTTSIAFGGHDLGTTVNAQTGTIDFPDGYAFDGTTFIASAGATISLDDTSGGNNYGVSGTLTGSGAGNLIFSSGGVSPYNPNGNAPSAGFNFPAGFAQVTGGYFDVNPQDGPVQEITNIGFLNYVGSAQHNDMGLINQGTIDVTGTGNLDVDSNGTFTNTATGTVDFQTDAGITNLGGNAGFTDAGLIEKTGGTGVSIIGVANGFGLTINSGAFYVKTGTLSLQNGGNSIGYTAGSITVASGATFDLNVGAGDIYGSGTFISTGGGHVTFSGGSWEGINGAYNSATPSTLDFAPEVFSDVGGTFIDSTNDINTGAITFTGANTLTGIQNSGTLLFPDAGPLTFRGNLYNNASGVIDFEADTVINVNGNNTFSNSGTIVKTGGVGTLDLSNGPNLTNSGTIRSESGTILLPESRNLFAYFTDTVPAGSTYEVDAGATIALATPFSPLTTIDGTVILNGVGASFIGLSGLATNNGLFEVLNGASFATAGSLINTGTLSVGGALTVNGNLTESQGAGTPIPPAPTLNFAVSALPGTAGAPNLTVTGSTTLAGNLSAEYTTGFGSNGDAYTVGNFASASSGNFASTAGVGPAFTVQLNPTTIVLNGANLSPISGIPDTYFIQGNGFLTTSAVTGVLANDSDPNKLPFTAVLLTNPADGLITLNSDGSFTYVPDTGYQGVDTFKYYATDGAVTSLPTTVTLNVGLAQANFSSLTAPASITYGTATDTFSGVIGAGASYVPTGETVAITLNGVTQLAVVGANGAFSSTFDTSKLPTSPTAYAVTYSYAGDSSFLSASDNSTTTVLVSNANVTIKLGNLNQTYTGSTETASVITTPGGLAVDVRYTQNNVQVTPVNAGSYLVTATITSPGYQGSATATLVIGQATQFIPFGSIAGVTYGVAPIDLSANATSQLPVSFSVFSGPGSITGNVLTILGAGTIVINADQGGNLNYQAAATVQQSLVVGAAAAALSFSGNLNPTYNGAAQPVGITTVPANLTGVTVTYSQNGNPVVNPNGAGTYSISASLNNANYIATPITGSLVIGQATSAFSSLTAPSNIIAGTANTTLSGAISGNGVFPPIGEYVSVTLNGIVQNATIGSNGTFSTIFNTSTLPVSSAAYPVAFSYAGDANFTSAANSATTILVNPAGTGPVITLSPANQPLPSNIFGFGVVTFIAAASGTPAPTGVWQVSTDKGATFTNVSEGQTAGGAVYIYGAGGSLEVLGVLTGLNGYEFREVFTNAGGSATTTAASLGTAVSAPAITLNPVNATVAPGGFFTVTSFTAAAVGNPNPTVQWQRSTDGGVTFQNIAGATTTTYTLFGAGATADNGYQYRAVFSNSLGSAITTAATLIVGYTAPVITLNPVSQTAGNGKTVQFTASATGNPTPTAVVWQASATGAPGSFVDLPSSDFTFTTNPFAPNAPASSILTFSASSAYHYVQAIFSNAGGSTPTTIAVLTIVPLPVVTTNPANQDVFAGETATFTASATGTPTPTVQWQVNNGSGFANIAGATSPSYSFTAAANQRLYQYRAVFTNAAGAVTTTAATLMVATAPVVTLNPTNQSAGLGQLVSFTAIATGNPAPSVAWQASATGAAGSFVSLPSSDYTATSTTFPNINTATTLTLSASAPYQYVQAVFSNSDGSTTATAFTSIAVLTLIQPPVITLNPLSQDAFAGQMVTLTAAASSTPAPTVQWQVNTIGGGTGDFGWSDIAGATSTTYSFTAVATPTGIVVPEYRALFSNSGVSTSTTSAVVTVATPPVVTVNPTNQVSVVGQPVTFTATATGNPIPSVVWQSSATGAANSFVNLPASDSTTDPFGQILGYTQSTLTLAASSANHYVRAVFTNSDGATTASATTSTAVLTLGAPAAPVILTNPTSQTVDAGQTVTLTAAASGVPTPSVVWQESTNGGSTFVAIGGTTPTYTFTAAATENGYKYRAFFSNGYGTAITTAATLGVRTAPFVTINPTSQSSAPGQTLSFTSTASANPAPTVQWQYSATGSAASFVGFPASDVTITPLGGGLTQTTLTISAGNAFHYVRAVYTNIYGSATSTIAVLNLVPLPAIITNPVSQTVRAGNTATFTAFANGTPAPSVQWQVSTDGGATFNNVTSGGTATRYSFATTAAENGYQYRAVFSNSVGGTATTSAAMLNVQFTPVVTVQPTLGVAYAGQPVTLNAQASGNPADNVQWQISTNGGTSYRSIPGANATSYTFTPTFGSAGVSYRAVFSNAIGSALTNAATLDLVISTPVLTTVNGVSGYQIVAAGAAGIPTIQWGLGDLTTDEYLSTDLNPTTTTVSGNQITSFIALSSFSVSSPLLVFVDYNVHLVEFDDLNSVPGATGGF